MARSRGAAARKAKALKAKALKAKVKSPAPAVAENTVAKRPVGRPRKNKRDPDEEVNELCVFDDDGYAEGTHSPHTHSHVVR
jgi:hypothetical protein